MKLLGIAVAAAVVGALFGWFLNNRLGRRSLEAMRKRGDEAVRQARHEAEKVQRAAVLEAKQEILAQRNKADRDLRSRRGQLQKLEKDLKAASDGLGEREARLQRFQDELRETETGLARRDEEIEATRAQLQGLIDQQNEALERVSGMTRDEARRQLLTNLK